VRERERRERHPAAFERAKRAEQPANGSYPKFPPVCCWARTHTGIRKRELNTPPSERQIWTPFQRKRDGARAPGGAAATAAIKALRCEKVADPSAERTIVFSGAHTAARCALPYVTVADFHWIPNFHTASTAHRKILTHSQAVKSARNSLKTRGKLVEKLFESSRRTRLKWKNSHCALENFPSG